MTVLGWSLDQRADRVSRVGCLDEPLNAAVVSVYLVGHHRARLVRLLSAVGHPYADAALHPRTRQAPVEPQKFSGAVRAIRQAFDARTSTSSSPRLRASESGRSPRVQRHALGWKAIRQLLRRCGYMSVPPPPDSTSSMLAAGAGFSLHNL